MQSQYPLFQGNPKQEGGERGNRLLHLLDFYIGVPLVFLLSIFRDRKKRPQDSQIRKIGILQTAAIGDTLLMSSPLRDLRLQFPDAEITIFHGPSNQSALPLFRGEFKTQVLRIKNPFYSAQLINQHGPFDLWIDFGPWPRLNALLCFFVKAYYKVGFQSAGQFRHYGYDLAVEHSHLRHEIENQRALIRAFAPNLPSVGPLTVVASEQKERFVVFHMFPGGSRPHQKEWPTEYWLELLAAVIRQGYRVAFTGAPCDLCKTEALLAFWANYPGNPSPQDPTQQIDNLVGKKNLLETAQLLARAQAVVSVNTGILHLAALVGANLVGLHGPTSAKRWGPVNTNSVPIQSPRPCSPCLHLGSDYACPLNSCMQELSPESVLSALQTFLSPSVTV
ncbi:MAG: glycosyltransferase family 9 protein [Verrucomicrobiota bacterium]